MVTFTPNGIGKLDKGFKENWKDLPKLFGQKQTGAPPGTVPVGDGGWYTTPDTPADPRDCTRYPNSPWCGGNPLDSKPVAVSITPSVHQCGFDVEIEGTLAFIKGPPMRIAYRYEGECRKEPPKDVPAPLPPGGTQFNYPKGIALDTLVFAFFAVDYDVQGEIQLYNKQNKLEWFSYTLGQSGSWTETQCPGGTYVDSNNQIQISNIRGIWNSRAYASEGDPTSDTNEGTEYFNQGGFCKNHGVWEEIGIDADGNELYTILSDGTFRYRYYQDPITGAPFRYTTPQTGTIERQGVIGKPFFVGSSEMINSGSCTIYKGRWGDILKAIGGGTTPRPPNIINESNQRQSTTTIVHVDIVVKQSCGHPEVNPYRKNPPPPNPDKDCKCMACCNDPRQNSDDLLRQLLAEIRKANKAIGSDKFPVAATIFDEDENKTEAQGKNIKLKNIAESISKIIERNEKISKIIGIDAFPLELPESVIVHPEFNVLQKALNFLNPFKNTKIHSVMELLIWKIKQDSAVLGQWGQTIQVQSTEKKKVMVDGKEVEKEQTKTEEVVLPNIAQTMKEQILLQSQQMKTMGIALDCIIKLLIDVAQSKAISAETVRRVEDIQQYLDYPTNEKTLEVPVQITFPNPRDPSSVQNDIFKLLQEGKITITYDDWTGEHSQDEKLLDLLQAAKTIQGVYFSKGG